MRCLWRRPAKTAMNARTSRAIFGELVIKELEIPVFIDMYNYYMNGVEMLTNYGVITLLNESI